MSDYLEGMYRERRGSNILFTFVALSLNEKELDSLLCIAESPEEKRVIAETLASTKKGWRKRKRTMLVRGRLT